MSDQNAESETLAEAIAYLREVNRGTVRAERVELLVAEIERLRQKIGGSGTVTP